MIFFISKFTKMYSFISGMLLEFRTNNFSVKLNLIVQYNNIIMYC